MNERNLWGKIVFFFDKLEDWIRAHLSRHPFLYTFIGGVGIVLFWRGVWHTADLFPFLSGPVTLIIATIVLLLTGLFVSSFIGEKILISGKRKEEGAVERLTEEEHALEQDIVTHIDKELHEIKKEVDELKEYN